MLLISLAISVAFLASAATTLGLLDLDFWWELALLVTIMLLGHWQEMRAIGQAQGAFSALAALLPDEAERITDHGTETSRHLRSSERRCRPGPSGRPRPGRRHNRRGPGRARRIDDHRRVPPGRARHRRPGRGRLGRGRLRDPGSGSKRPATRLPWPAFSDWSPRRRHRDPARRPWLIAFAAALFYVAVGAGLITFVVWSLIGDVEEAITRTVTVLVISCPHALGLAIPLVIAISTAIAARNGILVKDRLALERMRLVDTVLFDKTGTLTLGEHVVTDVAAVDGRGG